MNYVLKQMRYRFAVIYETLNITDENFDLKPNQIIV